MLDEPAGGKSAYIVWKHNLIKVSLHLAACLSKSFDQKFVAPILKAVTVLQAKSPTRYMFTNTQVPNLDYTQLLRNYTVGFLNFLLDNNQTYFFDELRRLLEAIFGLLNE